MKKQNYMLYFVSKHKRLILLSTAIFPFVLNGIVAQPVWPYWNVAGDSCIWISFWGAYAGAMGTVFMAIIAVETLKSNAEQLELMKKTNRPHLFCSIFILYQRNHDLNCNEEFYILRVENHGTQIAKHVKIKIDVSDHTLFSNTSLKKNLESIGLAEFSLPARGEKNFVIGNAIPCLTQGESKTERMTNWENQWRVIEQLKRSTMTITLSCEGYEDEHEVISLNSVGYLPTTTVQVLDYINQNIKALVSQISNNMKEKS